MTLDVYSGLFDDDLDGVAAQLDEQLTRTTSKIKRTAKVQPMPRPGRGAAR